MRKRAPLTPLQYFTAGVIAEYWQQENRSPTFTEIAEELSISSKSGVHRLVTALERKGWLRRRRKGAQHSLQLTCARFQMPAEHSYSVMPESRVVLAGEGHVA
ncbi:MAG: MarR family transcriptional regulator [Rhodospirillales bacterium]